MKGLLISFIVLMLIGCSAENISALTKVPPTKYRFEQIKLPDGTPCYVVKGGSHSNIVGITCNYGEKK